MIEKAFVRTQRDIFIEREKREERHGGRKESLFFSSSFGGVVSVNESGGCTTFESSMEWDMGGDFDENAPQKINNEWV